MRKTINFFGYEIQFDMNEKFCYANVVNQSAVLISDIFVKNVRVPDNCNWLNLRIGIFNGNSERLLDKPIRIRNLQAGESRKPDNADCFVLPIDLRPGYYTCGIYTKCNAGEDNQEYPFEILAREQARISFEDADLLSAYVPAASGEIKSFSDRAVRDVVQGTTYEKLRALYNAVQERQLGYAEVASRVYANMQQIKRPEGTLESGGSCLDLSIMFATMCMALNIEPILVLMSDHMFLCCRSSDAPKRVINGIQNMDFLYELLQCGDLIALETTCVCSNTEKSYTFESAVDTARLRVSNAERTCAISLVDVCAMKRSGVRSVFCHETLIEDMPKCPECGHVIPVDLLAGNAPSIICPACTHTMLNPHYHLNPDVKEVIPAIDPNDNEPPNLFVLNAKSPKMICIEGEAAVCGASEMVTDVVVSEMYRRVPIRRITRNAFAGTVLETIQLPACITDIESYAFRNCRKLSSIRLPDGLRRLGNGAFQGCTALKEIVIPMFLNRIPQQAFQGCAALHRVSIAEGIERIESYAFADCVSLEEIVLPASVKCVDAYAFEGCTALKRVTMLNDDTRINGLTFYKCPALK